MKNRLEGLTEFANEVCKRLWYQYGIHVAATIKSGEKENISLYLQAENGMSPLLDFSESFDFYLHNKDIDFVVKFIYDLLIKCISGINTGINEYADIKSRLVMKLEDSVLHNNDRYIYSKRGEFVVKYYVNLFSDEQSVYCMPIIPELLNIWGVTKNKVYEDAINRINQEEPVLFDLSQFIVGVNQDRSSINQYNNLKLDPREIYVLSNETGLNGATMILRDGVMNSLYNKLGEFYILPSSVHEVIIVAKSQDWTVKSLRDTVVEANSTVVDAKDLLSNDVFIYNGNIIRAV